MRKKQFNAWSSKALKAQAPASDFAPCCSAFTGPRQAFSLVFGLCLPFADLPATPPFNGKTIRNESAPAFAGLGLADYRMYGARADSAQPYALRLATCGRRRGLPVGG